MHFRNIKIKKMKNKYLLRLDDACSTMNSTKWQIMEDILDKYNIRPMVGIIPHNEDVNQLIDSEDFQFWNKVDRWFNKKWTIALHGYNHCYSSNNGLEGLNPFWSRSEFSGLPLEVQKEKIRKGVKIMREHGIDPKYFFAPSHTFDENTLNALRDESNIRIISDTIAIKPYRFENFIFIPQLGGHFTEIKIPGFWTFCLHPSEMEEKDFFEVDMFLDLHKDEFVSFYDLNLSNLKKKDIISHILSWMYFKVRKFKGIK